METTAAAALIEEAAKKSDLLWLATPDGRHSQPVWHIWQDGAIYVLSGGAEQPVPDGIDDRARVTLRSKDKRSRLITVETDVAVVEPESDEWQAVVPTLRANRLNLTDAEQAPDRWARESVVLRLRPTETLVETPDAPTTTSHAAPPPPTPARSRVPRPLHLRGRPRKNRGGH